MNKILWLTSLRPVGLSKNNDFIQKNFINSVKNIDADITFSFTQFEEKNIQDYINNLNVKNNFINYPKANLKKGKKYSNKIMLENALKQFIDGDYEYLVHSTADLQVASNVINIVNKINQKSFCALVYPNILIKNGILESSNWPHYGIDLFFFKIDKNQAQILLKSIENWEQYNWGVIDNFYIAVCDLLKLKIFNLFKNTSVLKYENKFEDFDEDRSWQKQNWVENNNYFKIFLKENNLTSLYAYGSYYYILLKILRISDLNLSLIISYFKFFTFFPLKKIYNIFFNFRK